MVKDHSECLAREKHGASEKEECGRKLQTWFIYAIFNRNCVYK